MSKSLQEAVYKHGHTAIILPAAQADFVIKWGRQMIADKDLYYDNEGGCGRETDPHITVLYGLTDSEPSKELLELVRKTPPFTVRLTGVTLFENQDYDVVKFDVESEELEALSNAIRLACPNENKYPKYIPHCTVAYVKKGRVPDLAGNYPFEQNPPVPAEFEVNEIIFKPAGDSEDPKRKTTRLPLNRYRKEAEDPKAFLRSAPRTLFVVALKDYVPFVRNRMRIYYWDGSIRMLKPEDGEKFKSRAEAEAVVADLKQDGIEAWVEPYGDLTQEAEDPKAIFKQARDANPVNILKSNRFHRDHTKEQPNEEVYTRHGKLLITQVTKAARGYVLNTWAYNHASGRWDHFIWNTVWQPKTHDFLSWIDQYETQTKEAYRLNEAEDPKAALKIYKVTTPTRFKYVPVGFYFRTPYYPLVRKIESDPETGANALTTDMDTVRPIKFPPGYWVYPPKATIDDITSGPDLNAEQTYTEEGLDEAEDPKSVLRLAKAASGAFVLTRVYDAYGLGLKNVHYFHIHGEPGNQTATWTPRFDQATQFRTEEEAWNALKAVFGDDISYWKGGVDTQALNARDVKHEAEDPKSVFANLPRNPDFWQLLDSGRNEEGQENWCYSRRGDAPYTYRFYLTKLGDRQYSAFVYRVKPNSDHEELNSASITAPSFEDALAMAKDAADTFVRHSQKKRVAEGEDPKSVLKAAGSVAFVIYSKAPYTKLNYYYHQHNPKESDKPFWWTVSPVFATRFPSEEAALAELRKNYRESDIRVHNIKVGTLVMAAKALGEAEDPKAVLRSAASALTCEQVTIHWVDQHGGEHQTSYFDLPLRDAEEELKKNLVINRSPYTVARVIDVVPKRLSPRKVGESAKAPFDLLQFPIEASVLASKLLELDRVEKPAVL